MDTLLLLPLSLFPFSGADFSVVWPSDIAFLNIVVALPCDYPGGVRERGKRIKAQIFANVVKWKRRHCKRERRGEREKEIEMEMKKLHGPKKKWIHSYRNNSVLCEVSTYDGAVRGGSIRFELKYSTWSKAGSSSKSSCWIPPSFKKCQSVAGKSPNREWDFFVVVFLSLCHPHRTLFGHLFLQIENDIWMYREKQNRIGKK